MRRGKVGKVAMGIEERGNMGSNGIRVKEVGEVI